MKKINLAITGCLGRMGQQLVRSSKRAKNFKIVSVTENRVVNKKVAGLKTQLNSESAFKNANIIIDFTVPRCTLDVLKIASKLKLNKTKLIRTINRFKGLDYRQQIIYDKQNLKIINDSKSTSFSSSESVLKNLNDAYWILGGIPKKGDQFKLSKTKCKNLKTFIFGSYSKKFLKILKNKLKVKSYKNLQMTLQAIFSEINGKKLKKNIIFFSPAGASFDSFKNFEDRGEFFNKLIKKYINEK